MKKNMLKVRRKEKKQTVASVGCLHICNVRNWSQKYRLSPTHMNLKGIVTSEGSYMVEWYIHCNSVWHALGAAVNITMQPTLILISGFLTLKSSCAKYS
jgi:hypothetical protein